MFMTAHRNYGRPVKPFFIEIQSFWGSTSCRQIGQINSGAFALFFGQNISTHDFPVELYGAVGANLDGTSVVC